MSTRLRVLIVEDSEDDAMLLLRTLRHGGYEPLFERVETADGLRAALTGQQWDVVLADYRLPQFDGLEALRLVRQGPDPDLPFIVVSGAIGEDLAVATMKAGAHDYVLKDNLARLLPAIARELAEAGERRRRREAELALRESGERLALAQRAGHIGLFDWDLTTGRVMLTAELEEMLGLEPGQFGGHYDGWAQRVHPDDLKRLEEWVAHWQEFGREEEQWEYRVVRPDGTVRWVEARGRILRDDTGRPQRIVGTNLDITDRRESEQALLQAKDEWERTFNTVPDLIAILDPHHHIIRANRAMIERLGAATDQGANLICYAAVHGTTNPPPFCPHVQTMIDGCEHMAEVHEPRLGGDFLVSTTPLKDANGKVVGVVHVARDITALKRAEKALALLNAELEERVQQRTGALEMAKLNLERQVVVRMEAEESLRRANRALRAISDCHDALLRTTNEADLLLRICEIVVRTGDYRMAWVGYAESDAAKSVRPVAQVGFEAGYLERARISWADTPRGRGPTGTAIRTHKPDLCRDLFGDPRMRPWRTQARRHGFRSSIALPLFSGKHCLGALTIYAAGPGAFTATDVALLTELATDLTYGILTLRTRAERERLQTEILRIAEREQQRIAQDLHDSLSQHLAGILFLNSALCDELAQSSLTNSAADSARINTLLKEALDEARDLARGLYPVKAEPDALMDGLRALTERAQRLFKVRCRFHCPRPVPTNDNARANHLYRIAQEALHNAVKHGRATRITVELIATKNQLRLRVRDDGVGMPPKPKKEGGLGLQTMRHRAEAIGGTLAIEAGPRGGTTVTCRVPLAPARAGKSTRRSTKVVAVQH